MRKRKEKELQKEAVQKRKEERLLAKKTTKTSTSKTTLKKTTPQTASKTLTTASKTLTTASKTITSKRTKRTKYVESSSDSEVDDQTCCVCFGEYHDDEEWVRCSCGR